MKIKNCKSYGIKSMEMKHMKDLGLCGIVRDNDKGLL